MKKNVGHADRILRILGGTIMLSCSALAPLPLAVRLATFGALGVYLLFTALAGTCFGYKLMGRSTCPLEPSR